MKRLDADDIQKLILEHIEKIDNTIRFNKTDKSDNYKAKSIALQALVDLHNGGK